MPVTKKPEKKLGHVTWNGRLIVDVNRLYRSKKAKSIFDKLDRKLENRPAEAAPILQR
jgi:hypothetical protein